MYGRNVINQIGIPIKVSADGAPLWHPVGLTIDWTTVAALASQTTYNDGFVVPAGTYLLRYGQVLCRITATGRWGPYDPAATGTGRDVLTNGNVAIVNQTVFKNGLPGLGYTTVDTDHCGGLQGGLVYLGRIIQAGTGTASLAAGPQLAGLLAAMPLLRPIQNITG